MNDGIWSIVNTIAEMEALTATAGDVCFVTANNTYYKYDENNTWVVWYTLRPSLAFAGITMEMAFDNLDTLFFGTI